ncbi:MAG: response regulator [Haloplanus sp.]
MIQHRLTGAPSVLHIDDDSALLELTAEFLTRTHSDIDVHSTTDVGRALEILDAEPIDCIVSDYDMPGTTGLEFLNTVHEAYPDLPFILYTGKGSEEIASEAINAGVTGYLQKGGAEQHRRLVNRVDHAVQEYRARIESQRYSTVLEALGYPIYVVGADGRFRYVNDAFVDLVGYERSELVGADPDLIKTDESVVEINEALRTVVSGSGPDIEHVEVEIRTKSGETITCKDHLAALPFDDEFQGCAGILRDLSDQRARERALQRENDRLEELVSVVSHDLRTPLATARSAAELAEETGETTHFDSLARAHERLESMLDELLTLARTDERTTTTDAVTITAVARAAWKTVDPDRATLAVDTDRTIMADPDQLQRLFENLFTNAVAHGGANATVTVGAVEGDGHGFYVADDGPGIDPEHRDTVFEPGVSMSADGTGFGLAIVDRIADAHGWDVDLTESADGGAQFSFVGTRSVDADRTGQSAASD